MDSIISSILEEICSQGPNGITLPSLWSKLLNTNNNNNNIALSPSLKSSIYSNLLKIPSLQFQSRKKTPINANDASIQRFEDAEKLNLKIVASSQLRDNFLGLYYTPSNLPKQQRESLEHQRRTLSRLALARSNGIAQSQLAKEFTIEGNASFNIDNVVRNLECRGLIVKQPAVLKTKELSREGESKNSSCVSTNFLYLYRYAKHLGPRQRLEVNKEGPTSESYENAKENAASGDGLPGESFKENKEIKDYLPAMKAVCDELQEANGKVLAVADIKQGLGYCGSLIGHRLWRYICRKLKDAGIVEEFDAEVNERVERCLRLLRNFSSKKFEPSSLVCGDIFEKEQEVKFGRRFLKTEQLVELPIDHQIYDTVDAEGSEGLAVMKVCDRLGIDKKKNHLRLRSMFSRFGMHMQSEIHNKTTAYRVWTPGNLTSKSSNAFQSKSKVAHGKKSNAEINSKIHHRSFGAPPGEKNNKLLDEPSGKAPVREHGLLSAEMETNDAPSEALSKSSLKPSVSSNRDSLRREQWILQRLQDEKFILRAELQKWLNELEDKATTIDMKTIERILVKLEQQGHCKCLDINVPLVTNSGRSRITRVVLHPSAQTPEALVEIHDRLRSFEMKIRGFGSARRKKNETVRVLNGVQRTQRRLDSNGKAVKSEDVCANRFVLTKKVPAKSLSSSQKRKKSLKDTSVKCARTDTVTGRSGGQGVATVPDTSKTSTGEQNIGLASSGEDDIGFRGYQEDDHLQTVKEPGSNAVDKNYHSLLSRCAFSKKKTSRTKRFSWTDEADRQLVIQYVRHRAALGEKFHCVDWNSLPHLPASSGACARRMSLLKRNTKFRKAVMKLCNMLSERYTKHLEESQNRTLNSNDCPSLERCSSRGGLKHNISNGVEHSEDGDFEEKQWDDFDDKNIDRVLEDVLRLKLIAKMENLERSGLVSSTSYGQSLGDPKFIELLNEGTIISRQGLESLAVSNAIELLKLVFLSNSTAPELQNLLAETLRCYSEHDLLAAFSYLREKKFMVGDDNSPFVLSQLFLHRLSQSPFPINAGKRAANFSSWLLEREKDLMEGGANLKADLQCGDIFHLFSLVFSGNLSISPCLPDEGVGEAEDLRCMKRRNEDNELCDGNKAKKLKILSESELISRREKGFPGIMVSVRRVTNLVANGVELVQNGKTCTGDLQGSAEFNTTLGHKSSVSSFQSKYMKKNFGGVAPVGSSSESPWNAMTTYTEHLSRPDLKQQVSFFTPQVFKAVYAAIQKSGDKGLSIKEVSDVVNMPGEKISECIIDVLQAFGRALKVNAYDSIRVVDALYRSKYSLTSMDGFRQDLDTPSLSMENHDIEGANSQREIRMNVDETQTSNVGEVCMHSDVHLPRGNNEFESYKLSSPELYTPILPWMNGDGTVNSNVYNGLRRHVLGKVMQNPGILEDEIIRAMDVLNPQSCKKLLELMVLDRYLIVRKMQQTIYSSPPTILMSLFGSSFRDSKMGYRDHFFANPMSTCLL